MHFIIRNKNRFSTKNANKTQFERQNILFLHKEDDS